MMQTFLEDVARRLYDKYGDDISSLSLFLPSKRARLFFADALSRVAPHPVWEPRYDSMDRLMCEVAELDTADKLRLLTELYIIYSQHHSEPFDKFYHWGEMLLADFDMVDKYKVDASRLFVNISDLKELEAHVEYISEDKEKMEALSAFWSTLCDGQSLSEHKERFLRVWRTLGMIYEQFRARLAEQRIGYTGMIHRRAIERIKEGAEVPLYDGRCVFVGFNALTTCERELLAHLSKTSRCDFFWDYDNYFVRGAGEKQEAGMFIRRSLRDLPSEEEGISRDNMLDKASIEVVSTSTNVAQCRYVAEWLQEIARAEGGELGKDTAVVLTDENLLMPLLYALPESLKVRRDNKGRERSAINVTMGYPLRHTLAYSFVERLLELQGHIRRVDGENTFYYVDVDGLLTHPYIVDYLGIEASKIRGEINTHRMFYIPRSHLARTPLLEELFCPVASSKELLDYLCSIVRRVAELPVSGSDAEYRAEYLTITVESLAKLRNMLNECKVDIPDDVCRSLVRRHLQSERIPFTGEPLEGLQIMGILETRNIDFRNVLILSMSDHNFPGNHAADGSFIPYSLRFAYGLPTPEHHEGVYAYYFYRLISRAERVMMIYSSHADDKSSGEPSRYIRQLEYESGLNIAHADVAADVAFVDTEPLEVAKDDEVMDSLYRFTDGRSELSPTAFSRYLKCPMMFYFATVARVRADDELEEGIDNKTFGNIFHKAAELLYDNVLDEHDPRNKILAMQHTGDVEKAVDAAIAKSFFGRNDGVLPKLNGDLVIIRNIVINYLRDNVMEYDGKAEMPFTVLHNEKELSYDFPFSTSEGERKLRFGGISDRIDSIGDRLIRIIDYKTGSPHLQFNGIESLFDGTMQGGLSNIVNTLLYSMMVSHNEKCDVVPSLYYVGKMTPKSDYSPLFVDKKSDTTGAPYSSYAAEFEANVRRVLEEIFDRSRPFRQCKDRSVCEYCDFADICAVKH